MFETMPEELASEPQWLSYFTSIDDRLHIVTVDLSWSDRAPVASLPFSLTLTVPSQPIDAKAAPGSLRWMSSEEEQLRLQRATAELQRIAAEPGARRLLGARPARLVYVGEVYRPGESKLYFYSERAIETRWLDELGRRCGITCEAAFGHAPTWADYVWLECKPALDQLRATWAQLEIRKQQGDRLSQSREVDHTVCFGDEEARAAFMATFPSDWKKTLLELDAGERRFAVQLTGRHSLLRPAIDSMVVGLATRASALGGAYDGWGALVVT